MFFAPSACTSALAGQDWRLVEIVRQRVGRRGVGEQKNSKIEPRLFRGETGICQIALPLLKLQIRFDHIGVSDLASRFQLLSELAEALGFIRGPLGHGKLFFRCEHAEVVADHSGDQSSASDFLLRGARFGLGGEPVIVSDSSHANRLRDDTLADILAHAVACDKDRRAG